MKVGLPGVVAVPRDALELAQATALERIELQVPEALRDGCLSRRCTTEAMDRVSRC